MRGNFQSTRYVVTPREKTRGVFVEQHFADLEGLLFRAEPALHLGGQHLRDSLSRHHRVRVTQFRVLVVAAETKDLVHRDALQELAKGPARSSGRNHLPDVYSSGQGRYSKA